MTDVTGPALSIGKSAAASPNELFESRWAAVMLASMSAFILSWPHLMAIWSTGIFVDTDDALRMVEVRDWLAGQGWYDLAVHRMDPPFGVFMHWSRIVDVPLAVLLKLFGAAFAPQTAERLARIALPLMFQVGAIASVTWVAERLEGRRAFFPAAFLIVLSGITYGQFQPGRIDHDDFQIVILLSLLGSILRAVEVGRERFAALAGVLAALSLGIGMENLPFLVILLAAVPIAWAIRGDPMRPALIALAFGLLPSLAVVYFATIGPSRWTLVVCDALSPFHLVGFGLGGLSCLGLALAAPRLRTITARLAAAGLAAACVIAIAGLIFPSCLGDPYAHVDPVVRALWLNNVSEARPLLDLLAARPSMTPMLILPIFFNLALIADGVVRSRGVARTRWAIVLILALTGCALSLWQVRMLDILAPIALFGGVRGSVLVWRAAERARLRAAVGLALLAIFPFGTITYALAPMTDDEPLATQFRHDAALCRQPDAYSGLAALPAGLVLAPIAAGSHLLAYTPHSVLGAPYHRNNRGNRFVLDAFRGDPTAERANVTAAGVRYVMVCDGLDPHVRKGSLADRLLAGDTPAWLKPAPIASTRLKVFELR